ncbi:MAG: type IV toxin-antitoxin system AbiEi family antitoxin [Rhodocyclaceae bacterium]
MNKRPDPVLIDRATHGLRDLGLKVAVLKAPRGAGAVRADAWLRIGRGKETTDYLVEAQRAVTPATVGAIVAQLRDQATAANRPALLVTDYLTPPVAERLRERQQQFADAAGNAYLDGPALLVYVVGRKPPPAQDRTRAARTFTANGLKVLFALLCDPVLAAAPHRTIAAAAGVALGAVPAVLGDLQQAGHLLVAEKNRRLDATKRLLDEWALAYARLLRPKTTIATYNTPHFDAWKDWHIDPAQAQWGGEPAAHLLVRHLKPGALTLYAERLPPQLMIEQRLVPAGRLGAPAYLELRKPFWGKALRTDGPADTVPPVLVYADLLAAGDGRCIETARMIYDHHLARLFPAA